MSDYTGLGELVKQMRETSRSIELSDSKMANRVDAIEASVDELYRKTQRPGGFGGDPGETDERKTAQGRDQRIRPARRLCR